MCGRRTNSPDLGTTDYRIWGVVQQRVYQTEVQEVNNLMQSMTDVWGGMKWSAIDQWLKLSTRLRLEPPAIV